MASIMRPTLLRQTVRAARPAVRSNVLKAVSFHNSSNRAGLLPPGPQTIHGTVNDPAPVPHPSAAHGSYHWTFERLLAAGLVPLSVAPFAAGSLNPTLDAILCSAVLLHSHIGFQACVIDYFPKREHPGAHRAAMWLLNLATVGVGVGLYEFETNDVGIVEAVKKVWKA